MGIPTSTMFHTNFTNTTIRNFSEIRKVMHAVQLLQTRSKMIGTSAAHAFLLPIQSLELINRNQTIRERNSKSTIRPGPTHHPKTWL
jgi:hypothetical protein